MNELLVVTPNGYKTSKLYSVVPANGTGDLTWVRNTTATRVNSSGLIESVGANVPRLDYTGGVTCPCILVEPQRTNYILRSEEFDNATWLTVRALISQNATTAPDGTSNSDKLIATNVFGTHYVTQSATSVNGSFTYSIFAKKGEYDYIYFWEDTTTGAKAYFNLNTGVATNISYNSISITNYGNGWYRCTATINSVVGNVRIRLHLTQNGSTVDFTGDNTSGVYIWGAQLEKNLTASSYIPTTSSSITRNADVATVTTPAGITSLIETYEDNTTNVVNPIPVTYQMSEGRIAKVVGL